MTPIKSVKIKTEIKKNPVERYCQSYLDIELFEKSKSEDVSPGIFIGKAPLKRINYLDNLF